MNDKVKTALSMVAESRPKMNLKTAPERADLEAQARADINLAASEMDIPCKEYHAPDKPKEPWRGGRPR